MSLLVLLVFFLFLTSCNHCKFSFPDGSFRDKIKNAFSHGLNYYFAYLYRANGFPESYRTLIINMITP